LLLSDQRDGCIEKLHFALEMIFDSGLHNGSGSRR